MDPKATLAAIQDAYADDDVEQVQSLLKALFNWINSGGFTPTPSVDEWNVLLALAHGGCHSTAILA